MKINLKVARWLVLGLCLVLMTLVSFFVLTKSKDDILKVTFLDVGQGDAIFIEAPNGNQVLVDGGSSSQVLRSLGEVMPFYDRSLDLVIATHPDADHIGGLTYVFDRFVVGGVLETEMENKTDAFDLYQVKEKKEKAQIVKAVVGSRIILAEDVVLDVLSPTANLKTGDLNDSSVILLLRFKESSWLLTGDASVKVENYLARQFGESLDIDVLKIGHHGSKTSSSATFLEVTSPDWAVISAGVDNRYGHPHPDVLGRLEKMDIPYVSTVDKGNIYFESDGNKITCRNC